jgi:hypothetical protein
MSAAQGFKPSRWRKRGLLIRPDPRLPWAQTHCMVPTPQALGADVFRVFFSGRDVHNRSNIGYAIVDLSAEPKVLEYASQAVLVPGELGCFDDNGVTPSSVVEADGRLLLYYIGWNPGSTVRVHLFGGLAYSDDGGATFQRYSRAPIIERNRVNPFLNTAPYVIRVGDEWRMYYVSGVGWVHKDLPRYNIQCASSRDGYTWQREGRVCIDFASPDEVALARPWVVEADGRYAMWFAHKGAAYRMGYAESDDGLEWRRDDKSAGLDVSDSGWDSEMVEYAAVVSAGGQRHMFYNGNNYGYDGIGLATEE